MGENKNPTCDQKDFIIKELEKTGFTLERYVVNILAKDGWAVTPNGHFHDRDLNKDREIDVLASKEIFLGEQAVLLTFYLVIECKKNPFKAWVFFPGPVEQGVEMGCFPQILTLLDKFNIDRDFLPLSLWDMACKNGFYSSGFHEIILDSAGEKAYRKSTNEKTDDIFEAVTKVVKAADYMKEIFLKGIHEDFSKYVEEGSPMNFGFVFPIVVFEGPMYSAIFPLNRENLKETSLINYSTDYHSGIYEISSNIDIVEKRFFEKYLSKLIKDMKAIEVDFGNRSVELKNNIAKKIGESLRP
jgi:hypothetical protein